MLLNSNESRTEQEVIQYFTPTRLQDFASSYITSMKRASNVQTKNSLNLTPLGVRFKEFFVCIRPWWY